MAIAVSESPTGPFAKLTDGWLRNRAIDGHFLFDDDGSVYLYFADLRNNNRIFAGKMSADLTKIEYECENVLIEAAEPWETLELFAKISLNAHLLGGAKEIPKEQIDKLLYLRDNDYHVTGKHPWYKHYNNS